MNKIKKKLSSIKESKVYGPNDDEDDDNKNKNDDDNNNNNCINVFLKKMLLSQVAKI